MQLHVLTRFLRSLALVATVAAPCALPSEASAQAATDMGALRLPPQLGSYRTARPTREIDWDLVNDVFAAICKTGIREPQMVMRQAILETGWFRSPSLMRLNNLFGFRTVNYLSFESLEDSIAFYKQWQDSNMREVEADYYGFLERVKYAAPGYTRLVRQIEWNEECPK